VDHDEWDDSYEVVTETNMEDKMMKVIEPQTLAKRPKLFNTREEYLALENMGLVKLPQIQGVFLSFHPATSQWHSAYPAKHGSGLSHRAPKCGEGLRTPRQALLLALQFLWKTHFLRTGQGESHLALLDAALT